MKTKLRPIALAYIDSDLEEGERIEVQLRGKTVDAIIMERNLTGEAPPYARPLFVEEPKPSQQPRRSLYDFGFSACGAGGCKHIVAAESNLPSHSF